MNEITYEKIQKANETIITTDIKGKDYAEVNQRIKAFRMVYPQGTIETRMISNQNGVCIFEAKVYSEPYKHINTTIDGVITTDIQHQGVLLATGTAYEKEGSTFINKTSYIENCETSAVGRALGMCGFGIDTSVASAEEVENAMANQEEQKATPKQVEILNKYYKGDNLKKLLDTNQINKLEDLPITKASELISAIMQKGNK